MAAGSCCSVARTSFGTTPQHQKWLNTDAAGLFNLVVTWVLLVGIGGFYVNKYIIPRLFGEDTLQWHCAAFNTLLVLAFVSHVRVAFTDPGTIPLNAEPTPQTISSGATLYRCKRCSNFKPPRAHHCRICNRCITKMDHHCPWVNNCVGVSNQKFFFLFLGYALVVCAYGIFLMAKLLLLPVDTLDEGEIVALSTDHAAASSRSDVTLGRGPTALEPGVESPLIPIVVLVVAACAAMFLCVMLRDQLKSLFEGVAKIDRLKNQQAKGQSNGLESASSSGSASNGTPPIQTVENDKVCPVFIRCRKGVYACAVGSLATERAF
eukprot:INCI10382.3.p1 GENE.INCI10382.3~~INCI10382.3.p1  ORF type:complete len:321 (+),score=31.14 INCI10382.3:191-1153(+)